MSEQPAGWYDDGSGSLRYFDGTSWTEHVAGYAPHPPPASANRKGMPTWGWVLSAVGVVVVLLGLAAVGVGVFYAQRAPLDAATAAIKTYDDAWRSADCDTLAEATTSALRVDWGYDDCSAFVEDAEGFNESQLEYATVFVSKEYAHGEVTVVTKESFTEIDGTKRADYVTYTVVKEDDEWLIDAIDFESKDPPADDHANV